MLEELRASRNWSPSSELPSRLSHRLVTYWLLCTIRVAMCTMASRIYSLVLFMSRMVRTCRFEVLLASFSNISTLISTLAWNCVQISCVSPSSAIESTVNSISSFITSEEQSRPLILTMVIGLFRSFLRIIYYMAWVDQHISPVKIV